MNIYKTWAKPGGRVGLLLATFLLAGFFSSAVATAAEVAAPRPTTPSASFPMGVDVNGLMTALAGPNGDQLADELVSLNAGWVRFEFRATDPNNLRWYDRAIGRLEIRGIHMMAVLVDPWYTCETDMSQNDPTTFVSWVREVYLKGCGGGAAGGVHQLGFDELTERYPFIQDWQIWNEPNVCGFLPSDLNACGYGLWRKDIPGGEKVGVRYGMQKFGALLATVYEERANKQVKIITGGILNAHNCAPQYDPVCNTPAHPGPENCYKLLPAENYACDGGVNLFINSDAVQRYKKDNNRLPFDVLGLHPYQPYAWANGYVPPADYIPRDIALNVRRFVDSSYPIWITEWGWDFATTANQPPTCRYPTYSSTQTGCEQNAAALLESLVSGLNARPDLNIAHIFWFNLQDQSDTLQAGLMDQTGRKRASWYSFQAASKNLGSLSQRDFQSEIIRTVLNQFTAGLKNLFERAVSQK